MVLQTDTDSTRLQWLRGDLHNHCERFELVEEMFEGANKHLDFGALTNHAHKDVFFSQHEMVAHARELVPKFTIFFGMEWNAPEGHHANLIFPLSDREADHAYTVSRRFDRKVEDNSQGVKAALKTIAGFPSEERPLLFFNHPLPGQWSAAQLDRYLKADEADIVAGIEAVHGHQAYCGAAKWNLETYPGCTVGGLTDHVYAQGSAFSLLANSDFHVHKQKKEYDYPLGIFNHTLVGVPQGEQSANAILAAVRAGRTCAAQGHWLDLTDFALSVGAQVARLGDCATTGEDGELTIAFTTHEDVTSVNIIGRLSERDEVAVLREFGPLPSGDIVLQWPVPASSRGYLRLCVISADHSRPAPGPNAPKGFFTSAIYLG